MAKRIENVRVVHKSDNDGYPDYLELDQDTIPSNKKRLEAYNRDEWWPIGIIAEADILTSCEGNSGSWLINRVTSGGLWGIESDAGEEYFKEIEEDQLAELADILKELGFSAQEIQEAFEKKKVLA